MGRLFGRSPARGVDERLVRLGRGRWGEGQEWSGKRQRGAHLRALGASKPKGLLEADALAHEAHDGIVLGVPDRGLVRRRWRGRAGLDLGSGLWKQAALRALPRLDDLVTEPPAEVATHPADRMPAIPVPVVAA